MAGILQTLKAGDALAIEGFWPGDKCRIRAELCYQPTIGWLIKPLPGYIVQIMGLTLFRSANCCGSYRFPRTCSCQEERVTHRRFLVLWFLTTIPGPPQTRKSTTPREAAPMQVRFVCTQARSGALLNRLLWFLIQQQQIHRRAGAPYPYAGQDMSKRPPAAIVILDLDHG